MLVIIFLLVISWLIIWLFEKGNIRVLGFYPSKKRITGFVLFFMVTALCCSSGFFMRMIFAGQHWAINTKLTATLLLTSTWWVTKSVLTEELIFRGVLLYILIKKLGHTRAIFISAAVCGIYHWFFLGVIGDPVQMLIIFFVTGIPALVYAYAYSKTFSLFYPIAIHLGWNAINGVIFSDGVLSNQVFTPILPVPELQVGSVVYYGIVFIPMVSAILINYFILRRLKQVMFVT